MKYISFVLCGKGLHTLRNYATLGTTSVLEVLECYAHGIKEGHMMIHIHHCSLADKQ